MLTDGQLISITCSIIESRKALKEAKASTAFFDDFEKKLMRAREINLLMPLMPGREAELINEANALERAIAKKAARMRDKMAHCEKDGKTDNNTLRELFGPASEAK